MKAEMFQTKLKIDFDVADFFVFKKLEWEENTSASLFNHKLLLSKDVEDKIPEIINNCGLWGMPFDYYYLF